MINIIQRLLYRTVKKIIRKFGYDLKIWKRSFKTEPYEIVIPRATYAPWLMDHDFVSIFEIIKNNTLVDKYRCFELWQLIKETAKIDGAIIEIGVWKGGTGCLIAKQAELCAGGEGAVYLCDTFTGVPKASERDNIYKGNEHADTTKEIVEDLIRKLELKNILILTGVFPDETGKYIENINFKFCHIDVDVYQSAKDILEWIWLKMLVGGIIVFDDYGFYKCQGITELVNEEKNKKDRIVIHNLNGHGIIIKIE